MGIIGIIAWVLIILFSGFIGGLCITLFAVSVARILTDAQPADHDMRNIAEGSEADHGERQ